MLGKLGLILLCIAFCGASISAIFVAFMAHWIFGSLVTILVAGFSMSLLDIFLDF